MGQFHLMQQLPSAQHLTLPWQMKADVQSCHIPAAGKEATAHSNRTKYHNLPFISLGQSRAICNIQNWMVDSLIPDYWNHIFH